MKKIGIIMGSDSDLPVVEKAIEVLQEYQVPVEVRVLSAHRCPDEAREFAASILADDLRRMEYVPGQYYNFHPGSHLNEFSKEECLARIAESINIALDKTQGVTAVIENTAGQGSNMGFSFYHLAEIIVRHLIFPLFLLH